MGWRNAVEIMIDKFNGGQVSTKSATALQLNEALSVDNIIIKPRGSGFRNRRGNSDFNSSAMVGATTPVTGLGYFKNVAGNDFLCAVAGDKFFKSDSLDGTMDDVTGGITITSAQNNIWQLFTFDDLLIGVGGAPDAPFKYSGTGNAAALGGTPPNGTFGFAYNNRAFIGNTTANPSRIFWSVLNDPEDWSGTGSGNADISLNDNEPLIGAAKLNDTNILLFKQTSIHRLVGKAQPFSVFLAFAGIGAVGKNAIVEADGLVYFITPQGRMAITDGTQIIDDRQLPQLSYVDDLWDGLNTDRLEYIQGIRYHGDDFDWIIWVCSDGAATTNDLAIIWDIKNSCWLKCSTGFEGNIFTVTPMNTLYMGGYKGKIYTMDADDTYTDASNSGDNVYWHWQSGWITNQSLQQVIRLDRLNANYAAQNAGNITIRYGYDFIANQRSVSYSLEGPGGKWDEDLWDVMVWGGFSDLIKPTLILGRGHVFNYKLEGSDAVPYVYNMTTLVGRQQSQKHADAF